MRRRGRRGSPARPTAATPAVLGMVQRAWSLHRARRDRGDDGRDHGGLRRAASSWRRTAATWSRCTTASRRPCGRERLPHLPRLVDGLPKDKEWLPNLLRRHRGSAGGRSRRRAGRARLRRSSRPTRTSSSSTASAPASRGRWSDPSACWPCSPVTSTRGAGHFERALAGQRRGRGTAGPGQHPARSTPSCCVGAAAPGDAERRDRLLREAGDFYARAGIPERVAELEPLLVGAVEPPTAEGPDGGSLGAHRRRLVGHVPRPHGRAAGGQGDGRPGSAAGRSPAREVHVLDLVGPAAGAAPRQGDLGEVLDDRARAAYKAAAARPRRAHRRRRGRRRRRRRRAWPPRSGSSWWPS